LRLFLSEYGKVCSGRTGPDLIEVNALFAALPGTHLRSTWNPRLMANKANGTNFAGDADGNGKP